LFAGSSINFTKARNNGIKAKFKNFKKEIKISQNITFINGFNRIIQA